MVGETQHPRTRIQDYVRAATQRSTTCKARIERHFAEEPDHSTLDLEVMFIDKLPPGQFLEACSDGERVRLEETWCAKLNASLNVRRQVRNSFTGFAKARKTPALDGSQTQPTQMSQASSSHL